ncbi:hypothetical protein D1BOALGB6SA_7921 [Olavius sp. associated proteobacterium Delta 1]|nr:hypothetical protein D1BOALGB6SA_7921 [Olavius sp. associated proteobacterium Delta 1]
MIKRTITRRQFLKNGLKWCGMAAMPGMASACGGRSAAKNRQIATEAENISLREIAHRKLHHGDGCFLNLFGGPVHGNPWRPSLSQSVKNSDSILYNYSYKPYYKDERVVPVSIDWDAVANNPELSITFIKHACIMIKDRNQYILIDPVFFDLPVVKAFTPLDFDIKDMPAPDHVLITHGHYDHLDVPSLAALIPQTHVISPLGYNSVFNDLKMNHRTQLDWYDTFEQDGTAIKLLPCMHWTMRNPLMGANNSLCGSFRLTSEPVHFPPIQLKAEMTKAGIADRLLHLNHGETLYYG